MDLSSLQNDLPRGKPSPPPSLPPPTLTADFKAAALAVTRLYQNSARQIDNARQEGYLSAVQEVAALLSSGELAGDRLREWCAVGLSRITAQQDEENRSRHAPRTTGDTHLDEDTNDGPARREQTAARETTSPASSPVVTSRTQFQNPFGNTEFTFQSPIPGLGMGLDGYSPPFGGPTEPEVTYEVIENGREANGRKRVISHQLGSVWDVGGNGGHKRSRHV